LLRPDRYVAACIPTGDLAEGAEKVGRLVASTFIDVVPAKARTHTPKQN
jgi:hypothetical protein